MAKGGRKPFAQVLTDLVASKHPGLDDLRALADLSTSQLEEFKRQWPGVPADTRVEIMTRLGELVEGQFDLNINAASRAALADSDDRVRAAAIRNLWEDQGLDLIEPLLNFLAHDESVRVRTAAATALGIYVYLGEMEELPADEMQEIEDALLGVFDGGDAVEIRRRALESLGFSQRPEVADAIDRAYTDGDDLMQVSALFAMGRSLDPDRWGETVLEDLAHPNPEIRFEAARAAGELQLDEAVPALGPLTGDSDGEVQEISIWALGEIGGEEARRILEEKLETADEALSEQIEDALSNAELMDGIFEFETMDIEEEEEDEQARKARLN